MLHPYQVKKYLIQKCALPVFKYDPVKNYKARRKFRKLRRKQLIIQDAMDLELGQKYFLAHRNIKTKRIRDHLQNLRKAERFLYRHAASNAVYVVEPVANSIPDGCKNLKVRVVGLYDLDFYPRCLYDNLLKWYEQIGTPDDYYKKSGETFRVLVLRLTLCRDTAPYDIDPRPEPKTWQHILHGRQNLVEDPQFTHPFSERAAKLKQERLAELTDAKRWFELMMPEEYDGEEECTDGSTDEDHALHMFP